MSARRIVVLVDGDNVSASHADRVMAEASRLGRVDIARVYAAALRPSDWFATPGFRIMHAGAGKNAADLLLSIDAMELALADGLESFVIATSDGDFTHIAQRLRERGAHVLGLGEEKAPETFRLACTAFSELPALKCAAIAPPVPKASKCSELDKNIHSLIAVHSKNGRGMRIVELNNAMRKLHGTQVNGFPEGSWRGYFMKRPDRYDIDPRGPDAMVRFRPQRAKADAKGRTEMRP